MHLTTRIAAGATVIALATSAPVAVADPTTESQSDQSAKVAAPLNPPPAAEHEKS